jgi:hypothetical protein
MQLFSADLKSKVLLFSIKKANTVYSRVLLFLKIKQIDNNFQGSMKLIAFGLLLLGYIQYFATPDSEGKAFTL